MALIPAKVIVRISSTTSSDLGELSWEWVLRADGEVCYRLTKVDGHPERNPWTAVTRLPATGLQPAQGDHARRMDLVAGLARQHGHQVS
ncbi:MAG: hypothetical protein ACLPKI_04820 [Streptosporangiaceae bacterium]